MEKPFSQACENNKEPILQIIRTVFAKSATVWEIGSGTGQHACHFARRLPHLTWQPTDRAENLSGIESWIREANLSNLQPALTLDVNDRDWPCQQIEALFSANTLHIMDWSGVENFFSGLQRYLLKDAPVCIYGPFNYGGRYTSLSNERFDQWLKDRNSLSGIRDIEKIENLAEQAGLSLDEDWEMPANNRLLVLKKL